MYQADPDPYCYPDSSVLKNKADLPTQDALDEFETAMTLAPRSRFHGGAYRPATIGQSIITSFRTCMHGPERTERCGSPKETAPSAIPSTSAQK